MQQNRNMSICNRIFFFLHFCCGCVRVVELMNQNNQYQYRMVKKGSNYGISPVLEFPLYVSSVQIQITIICKSYLRGSISFSSQCLWMMTLENWSQTQESPLISLCSGQWHWCWCWQYRCRSVCVPLSVFCCSSDY